MTEQEIDEIYRKFHTPPHIIAHMQQVANVALKIAEPLAKKGKKINTKLLKTAALLHDAIRPCDYRDFNENELLKTASKEDVAVWRELREKYGKIGHAAGMAEIVKGMGNEQLAEVIEKHDYIQVFNLKSIEEKILYYADKRVNEDQIVPLATRLKEGAKRNMKKNEGLQKRNKIRTSIEALEQELIDELGILPI